jgi:transcriptional regulator with XRE-family HTH domain
MNHPHPETPKRRLGQWKTPEVCPGCDRADSIHTAMRPTSQIIQGEEIHCKTEKWLCDQCGADWMSPAQATAGVAASVEAFHRKHGMLTGSDVRARRELLNWTQEDLVCASGVSIASVKRIESGVHVLSKLHNDTIARALENAIRTPLPVYEVIVNCVVSGNACPSLPPYWEDESPWNEVEPWKDDNIYSAANSNELALAA